MCVIIDANLAGVIFSKSDNTVYSDFTPLLDWIFKDDSQVNMVTKMVTGGKNLKELSKVAQAAQTITEWQRSGKAKFYPNATIDAEEERLNRAGNCRSDDPHVIALARVSCARTLCTGDRELMDDFRNAGLVPLPRGKVYQRAEHVHLLGHTRGCPGYQSR